ncbi:MAG: Cysteinyl-tRNA synthetase [uncultured Sphingomonadaceae bacterium]|uniref:Cysteine--tRNA ligase n=1 Tax=uncultured Sphingomonadaceae bacterium TaxID=169976 RepID=A0A6J4SV99_9SPHN|nr:MAG: Cysteinyl-tRNA synthetase [uncultured Sphingomonadaceae bacterium]
MSELRLYDAMAREKRDFVPADPGRVTMYVCGPTVYGRAHVGNFRPEVVFDVLGRVLRHRFGANALVHARNITDVDDKIMAAAEREGVAPSAVASRYEAAYAEDAAALGVVPPTLAPRATEHIGQMIALIERLIAAGHAYEAAGHALFHVPSDPDYGVLSRRDREAMLAGARVEVAPYKRDPADFVLWKPSAPGVIGWESPWGRGRPGWHLECSAMIGAHLGETIDIHGGGIDLQFPHHENELAQSRCAHRGVPLARYWLHNGFLNMGEMAKMSKSLGNVATVPELLAAGHRGETIRLALLSAQYRQPLAWTEALLVQSKATLDRLYRAAGDAPSAEPDAGVLDALDDDLNTPLALARLAAIEDAGGIRASAALLGLLGGSADGWFQGGAEDAGAIEAAIVARLDARKRRDFAEADRIRADLAEHGILLEDGAGGTTWRRA